MRKAAIITFLNIAAIVLHAQRIEKTFIECDTAKHSKLHHTEKGVWIEGEKELFTGILQSLFCDSSIQSESNYLKGKRHGRSVDYWKGGVVRIEREYEHGTLISYKEYYDDGAIREEKHFNAKGQLHGTYIEYDYNGKILSSRKFENGTKVN